MGPHRRTRRAAAFPHRLEGGCPAGVPATVGVRECRDWWAGRRPTRAGPCRFASDKVLSSRFTVAPETTFKGVFDDSGIVEGFTQTCRARGCKHREATKTDERKFYPEHEVLLWPVPRVRRLRFHDLRRTCASLLQMVGAPTLAASQLLRLGSTETTERQCACSRVLETWESKAPPE